MIRLIDRWANRPAPAELERIESEIKNVEIDRDRRAADDTAPWATSAQRELDQAKAALGKGTRWTSRAELEAAWSALKAANRLIVRSYEATELADIAVATRAEASEKLHGWRRTAVEDLVGQKAIGDGQLHDRLARIERALHLKSDCGHDTLADRIERALSELGLTHCTTGPPLPEADSPSCTPTGPEVHVDDLERHLGFELREGVIRSREILDEHADNVYRKLAVLRANIRRTSGILLLTLLALIFVVTRGWASLVSGGADPDANLILESWRLLLVILVLGSLGALVSSATNLRDQDPIRRVPEQLVGMSLMGMRPLVGAASAAIVVIVLQTGVSDELAVTGPAIFAVALAAGFVERLVTKVVASASAATDK